MYDTHCALELPLYYAYAIIFKIHMSITLCDRSIFRIKSQFLALAQSLAVATACHNYG